MNKFQITILLIIAFSLGLVSCGAGKQHMTPHTKRALQALESMRQAGCDANVTKFFSYVDKQAVAKNFREGLIEKVKNIYGEQYSGNEKLVFDFLYDLYFNNIDYSDGENPFSDNNMANLFEQTFWQAIETEIEKGEDGGICTLEITGINEDSDEFIITDTGIISSWKFDESPSGMKVVAINLDTYIASLIEDDISNQEKTPAVSNSRAKRSSNINYDFRNTYWGMSEYQVRASETNAPVSSRPVSAFDNIILYKDEVAELKTVYGYKFIDNKLVSVHFLFKENHFNKNNYIKDYYNVKEILTRKYGKPSKDKTTWKNKSHIDNPGLAVSLDHLSLLSEWISSGTTIQLSLLGENYETKMQLIYESHKFKPIIDLRQDKAEEEGL